MQVPAWRGEASGRGAYSRAKRRAGVRTELQGHMALDRDDHKARIASLLADVPQFKEWIEAVGGLTTDSQGRAVILGLDAAETEEMILPRATDISGVRFQACAESTTSRGGVVTANTNHSAE